MNVTCTGCPAKYAVPDEKVRGKKVRITCKHCGTNIIVDGTGAGAADEAPKPTATQPAAAAANSQAAAQAVAPKQAKPAAEVKFIVGFADDRQETHTIAEIVELYSAGKIDDEALVWKDGMPDWLSPFDVPELAAAFRAKNVGPRANAPAPAPAPAPAFSPVAEDEATLVVRSPLDDPEVQAAIAAAGPAAATAAAKIPPLVAAAKPAEETAKPAAARVERRAGGDLFGKMAEAGSEGDVSMDLGPNEDRLQKMTGARNESSVLFSLEALTKSDPKATQAKAKAKEQERAASEAALFGESAPDALLNLGSSGMGAMSAPDFTKPVSKVAVVPLGDGPPVPQKGRGGTVLIIGLLAIAGAAAAAFFVMKKQPATDSAATPSAPSPTLASAEPHAPAASNSAEASAATSGSAASAGSAAPAASAAPSASAAASAASSAAASANTPSAKPATAAAPVAHEAAATPAAKPAAEAAAKPADTAAAAKPAEAPAAAEAAPFDKNAAVAALSAAAASAASCKTADGPTGSGKVSVTFAPSGRATATSVAGELAGTEVGGCVARLFRAAKVPPFAGDPVTVSKSFTVQ